MTCRAPANLAHWTPSTMGRWRPWPSSSRGVYIAGLHLLAGEEGTIEDQQVQRAHQGRISAVEIGGVEDAHAVLLDQQASGGEGLGTAH